MIFLGDLACPSERVKYFNQAIDSLSVLSDEIVVVNLEAVILDRHQVLKPETLYNHPMVLDALRHRAKKIIVSLANNHMYDYPEAIITTRNRLEQQGIGVFGLQEPNGDILPYEFRDGNIEYALFGHCWNLYSKTNPNKVNDIKIVDIEYSDFIKNVTHYIERNPRRQVYCFMHWNYDLEKYPFPMHVKLSRDLIDAGVSGVIGSHSHRPHGVEIYKGRPIAYCLGNFYLPSGIYFDSKLSYPECSRKSIGISIDSDNYKILQFDTDTDIPVRFVSSTGFNQYDSLPNDNLKQYIRFFKKNRVKRLLVPVFNNYNGRAYNIKNWLAVHRVKLIKGITKLLR